MSHAIGEIQIPAEIRLAATLILLPRKNSSGLFSRLPCKLSHFPGYKGVRSMPKFVIEREVPGVGSLSADQIQAIAQKSCSVLDKLGPQIQWLQSYVTDNKIYCIYIAPNEQMVREHASQGGFPANSIMQVRRVIDPTTSESAA
jgi:hypothetical protein